MGRFLQQRRSFGLPGGATALPTPSFRRTSSLFSRSVLAAMPGAWPLPDTTGNSAPWLMEEC